MSATIFIVVGTLIFLRLSAHRGLVSSATPALLQNSVAYTNSENKGRGQQIF